MQNSTKTTIYINISGWARPQESFSGCAIQLLSSKTREIYRIPAIFDRCTCNEAEFWGLRLALFCCSLADIRTVEVSTKSQLLFNYFVNGWKIDADVLSQVAASAWAQANGFDQVKFALKTGKSLQQLSTWSKMKSRVKNAKKHPSIIVERENKVVAETFSTRTLLG